MTGNLRVNGEVTIDRQPDCGTGIVEGYFGEWGSKLITVRFHITTDQQEKALRKSSMRCLNPLGASSRVYVIEEALLVPVQEDGSNGRRQKVKATQRT